VTGRDGRRACSPEYPARIWRRGRGQARRCPPTSGDVCDPPIPLADWRSFMDAAGEARGEATVGRRDGKVRGPQRDSRRRIGVGRARKRRSAGGARAASRCAQTNAGATFVMFQLALTRTNQRPENSLSIASGELLYR
jgi:hypothetical protein